MKLLVDGENFRHQIAAILLAHKKIDDKSADFMFDFNGFCQALLNDAQGFNITYYTTKIKQPNYKIPLKLTKRITAISTANRKWIARLTNQHVRVVKAGYLRVRESNACVHCGKKTLVLQEKGVDVRLATDLVRAAQQKVGHIALGSSDSDLVPAMQAATMLGAEITYVCYAGTLNRSVAACAKKVLTFDDDIVLKHFGNSA
jgi:uncharacterized LabA/DUF88 family protein